MLKNNLLLFIIIVFLLSSCASSGFIDSKFSNYKSYDYAPSEDCEQTIQAAVDVINFVDLLFLSNNEEESEYTFENEITTDSIVPYYTFISENTISIAYISLKSINSPFSSHYTSLKANRVISGKISLFEAYDNYGEKYFIIEKEGREEFIQVPKRKRKFRKFMKRLTADNLKFTNTIDINDYSTSFLVNLIEIYNSYYE